jgi:hypothetical protein
VAGAALTGIGVLVAACGSGSPAAAPAKTVTKTAIATPATAAPATSTSSGSAAPTRAPAGTGPCPTRSLGLKLGLAQGTAGSTYTVIDFTNISNVTCTLYGFPGVSFAGGTPVTQIGLAAAEDHSTARVLVTLAPGQLANALLQIADAGNYPPSRCDPVMATYLYPPNQTTPIFLSYKSATCAKPVQILTVSVVQPRSDG